MTSRYETTALARSILSGESFEANGRAVTGRSETSSDGLDRLGEQRTALSTWAIRLRYSSDLDDFPVIPVDNYWDGHETGSFATTKIYVVQTSTKVIERCILMATDPGDLVLDPTCGSGTTAMLPNNGAAAGSRLTLRAWRWRWPVPASWVRAIRFTCWPIPAKARLKEAEVTRTAPCSQPVHGNIRHGFVYERVPHITLKSIANNAEIDVIWDKWQAKLEPLRE